MVGPTASTLLLGFEPHASMDLVRFFEHARPAAAVHLVARAGIDLSLTKTPTTAMGSGTVGVGVGF